MRTRFLAVVVAVLVAVGLAAPVDAVRNGQPDNGAHPYVGLVVFYNAGGTPTHRCSGTMISSTALLTAGHCTFGAASAQVWFNEHVTADTGYPLAGGFTGTPNTHTYNGSLTLPDTGDLGVVVLNSAPGVGSASIAGVGSLDSLATQRGQQNVNFDVVGYGLQEVKPQEMAERSRLRANVRLINLRSALTDGFNIHHTGAPGTGGGTCFGDSGGPVFSPGTSTIVGVTSFVFNQNCAGGGAAYRVDTAGAHSFINRFLL
jgi:secreted trypsin-like serine protease